MRQAACEVDVTLDKTFARKIGDILRKYGREEGIRTLEGLHLTRVPGVLLQPLGHLSKADIIAKSPQNP